MVFLLVVMESDSMNNHSGWLGAIIVCVCVHLCACVRECVCVCVYVCACVYVLCAHVKSVHI